MTWKSIVEMTDEEFRGYMARRHAQPHRVAGRAWLFAKRTGLKKRPCVCGAEKVEMHHHDYRKDLEVAFLCRQCHRAIHFGKLKTVPVIHDLRDLAVETLVAFA